MQNYVSICSIKYYTLHVVCVVLCIHTIRICAEIFDNRVPNYIRKGRVARREHFKAGHPLPTRNGNPGRGTGRNHFPRGIFLSIGKRNPGGGKNAGSISKRGIFSTQETETLDVEQVEILSLGLSFSCIRKGNPRREKMQAVYQSGSFSLHKKRKP